MYYTRIATFVLLLLISFAVKISAQQNLTMYGISANPQANTLNPAITNSCKVYVGLPVISSLHFNYGNDAFTYRQFFTKEGNFYAIIPSKLHLSATNSISTEAYVGLLSAGLWYKKTYFHFSITDKTDAAYIFSKDMFTLLLGGNSTYETKQANIGRTGAYFDYRREYALGVARKINKETTIGIKGKLLFGKLNISTPKSVIDIYTNPDSFNLSVFADLKINTSLPTQVQVNNSGRITGASFNGNVSSILFNTKNKGLAFDIGFIHDVNELFTISGSILDLGLIWYRTDNNNYRIDGNYAYNGAYGDSVFTTHYFQRTLNNAFDQLNATLNNKSYVSFLPPRVYFNYQYHYTKSTDLNLLFSGKIYRYKVLPSFAASVNQRIFKNFYGAASWSFNNKSFKNFGLGIVVGRSPLQLYAFTDNILGIMDPLNSRNINLRFGINFIFGCKKKVKLNDCGCTWINELEQKKKHSPLRKK